MVNVIRITFLSVDNGIIAPNEAMVAFTLAILLTISNGRAIVGSNPIKKVTMRKMGTKNNSKIIILRAKNSAHFTNYKPATTRIHYTRYKTAVRTEIKETKTIKKRKGRERDTPKR